MFDEHDDGLQDEEYLNWLDREEKQAKLEDLLFHLFLYALFTIIIAGSIFSIYRTLYPMPAQTTTVEGGRE